MCKKIRGAVIAFGFLLYFGPGQASAQFVTFYTDRIENAQSTDIEGRDEVYFLLIGGSSTGKPVYIRAPKEYAKVEAILGGEDYYGLAPNTHSFKQWFHGGGTVLGLPNPTRPSDDLPAAGNFPIGTIHVPPDGYFLGCILIVEQDNAEAQAISNLLLGLGGDLLGGIVGGLGGELGKLLFPGTPEQEKKKLRALERMSEADFARKVSIWNCNCSTYAAQIREAKHQVIGSISFAVGFTTEGKLLTHWDAPPATQTMLLSTNSADVTAIATGHRAVYGFKLRDEPTKLVSFQFQHSNKCLDVPGASQENVTLQQFTCGNSLNQKWYLERVLLNQQAVGNRLLDPAFATVPGVKPLMAYAIRSAHNGKCLDTMASDTERDRHQVQQYDCHYGPGQLWVPEPQEYVPASGNQLLRLRSFSPWQCLDVSDNSRNDNAAVGTFRCKAGSDSTKGNQVLIRQ